MTQSSTAKNSAISWANLFDRCHWYQPWTRALAHEEQSSIMLGALLGHLPENHAKPHTQTTHRLAERQQLARKRKGP
jgi:hypothetical protein